MSKRATPKQSRDWRRTNDGVSVADIGFKKQLRVLDPELDVVWDSGSGKWEIWRFPGQKQIKKKMDHRALHMMTVQTKDRSFRQLGADIIIQLQASDPRRYSLDELVNYFDAMDDNLQRAKAKALTNRIDSITSENLDYIRDVTKRQVPLSYSIKPSESKLLLRIPLREAVNKYVLNVPKERKVERAIMGV